MPASQLHFPFVVCRSRSFKGRQLLITSVLPSFAYCLASFGFKESRNGNVVLSLDVNDMSASVVSSSEDILEVGRDVHEESVIDGVVLIK